MPAMSRGPDVVVLPKNIHSRLFYLMLSIFDPSSWLGVAAKIAFFDFDSGGHIQDRNWRKKAITSRGPSVRDVLSGEGQAAIRTAGLRQ